jgi:ribosome-associated translation inhibitor RaiA
MSKTPRRSATKRTARDRRAPLPGSVAKAGKAARGRTPPPETPAAIRVQGVGLPDATRRYVLDRLGRKLGKFGEHITRISVRFLTESGPKGAPTVVCRLKTVLPNLASVVVEVRHADLRAAFDDAADAHERAVRRVLERRSAQRSRA